MDPKPKMSIQLPLYRFITRVLLMSYWSGNCQYNMVPCSGTTGPSDDCNSHLVATDCNIDWQANHNAPLANELDYSCHIVLFQ